MASPIPDALVEKAARAIAPGWWESELLPDPEANEALESYRKMFLQYARAALEAAAPSLIAQGMREAAGMCETDWSDEVQYQQRILARAAEIEAPVDSVDK